MKKKTIKLYGVQTHNLKNIDIGIPVGKLTVITGVSGSGKSSLAFDTLWAEGNRRYIETLSTYTRQFLEKIDPPPVEKVENIHPAVALKQHNPHLNNRSTVGSITEISPLLRELFTHFATLFCPECNIPVKPYKKTEIIEFIQKHPKTYLLLPLDKKNLEQSLKTYLSFGFVRVFSFSHKKLFYIEDLMQKGKLSEFGQIFLLVDRFKATSSYEKIRSALDLTLKFHPDAIFLYIDTSSEIKTFYLHHKCPRCQKEFLAPSPQLFSFNSPVGACPECQGFGKVPQYHEKTLVPDPKKSILDGAIDIITKPSFEEYKIYFLQQMELLQVRCDVPFLELSPEEKKIIFEGKGDFEGINGLIKYMEKKKYKKHIRIMLSRLRNYVECPLCKGNRLNQQALAFRLENYNIAEVEAMEIKELKNYMEKIASKFQKQQPTLFSKLIKRINYLLDLSLDYLTLHRPTRTLSGGEFQRIKLASILGTGLYHTLYVLDEPTIGLHSRDTKKLLQSIKKLLEQENTVVTVEHDPEFIEAADYFIELGPGGGADGGKIVNEGNGKNFKLENFKLKVRPTKKKAKKEFIEIKNISYYNLKNISVQFPLHNLIVITGVSGAGKSSLLEYMENNFSQLPIIKIDQEPIGKTSRSIPATYLNFWDDIREIFSRQQEAKFFGWKKTDFSFNAGSGRCPECMGSGMQKVELLFLPDALITCEKCNGKRYKEDLLKVTYKGKNIYEVLEMTLKEAYDFFSSFPQIQEKIIWAKRLGIDYLKIGQPSPTLSGGESQRLKIAHHLQYTQPNSLVLLDEPTTGLHLQNIEKLLLALENLLDYNNTIICVEHNPFFIYNCDYVIDLGPEGGNRGGQVVFSGEIEKFLTTSTYTAKAVKEFVEKYG